MTIPSSERFAAPSKLSRLLVAFGYSLVIVIIAVFLGPRFEVSLAQTLALMNGEWLRGAD